MKAHVQCDLLQGSEEEEITPEFVLPPQTLVTDYSEFWGEGNKRLSYFLISYFPWSSLVPKSQPQKFNVLAVNNKAYGSQVMGSKMWRK